ncbi:hypothetical protein [Nocardia fluminea]|uniref:hypothetical protein n=1 Tax=Nocardia fluminea TaxID=134984 RepID=UPI003421BBE8
MYPTEVVVTNAGSKVFAHTSYPTNREQVLNVILAAISYEATDSYTLDSDSELIDILLQAREVRYGNRFVLRIFALFATVGLAALLHNANWPTALISMAESVRLIPDYLIARLVRLANGSIVERCIPSVLTSIVVVYIYGLAVMNPLVAARDKIESKRLLREKKADSRQFRAGRLLYLLGTVPYIALVSAYFIVGSPELQTGWGWFSAAVLPLFLLLIALYIVISETIEPVKYVTPKSGVNPSLEVLWPAFGKVLAAEKERAPKDRRKKQPLSPAAEMLERLGMR